MESEQLLIIRRRKVIRGSYWECERDADIASLLQVGGVNRNPLNCTSTTEDGRSHHAKGGDVVRPLLGPPAESASRIQRFRKSVQLRSRSDA